MRIRHIGCLFDVSLCRPLETESDVVADGTIEQDRLLTDDTDTLSEPFDVDVFNVMSVHGQLQI